MPSLMPDNLDQQKSVSGTPDDSGASETARPYRYKYGRIDADEVSRRGITASGLREGLKELLPSIERQLNEYQAVLRVLENEGSIDDIITAGRVLETHPSLTQAACEASGRAAGTASSPAASEGSNLLRSLQVDPEKGGSR